MGQPRPLFNLFSVFSNKQQINVKNVMSIQYTAAGFEPTTFRTWVSSHNHLIRAPAQQINQLHHLLQWTRHRTWGYSTHALIAVNSTTRRVVGCCLSSLKKYTFTNVQQNNKSKVLSKGPVMGKCLQKMSTFGFEPSI